MTDYLTRTNYLLATQRSLENLAVCRCGETYPAEKNFYLGFKHFLEAHRNCGGIIG